MIKLKTFFLMVISLSRCYLPNNSLLFQPSLPQTFHEYILSQMTNDPSLSKSGNNILPRLPALNQVYEDVAVKGALTSLLGKNFIMHPHRAVHHNPPGFQSQKWHRVRKPSNVPFIQTLFFNLCCLLPLPTLSYRTPFGATGGTTGTQNFVI